MDILYLKMTNILMNIQSPDRLKFISNFDGSAGIAIILKKKIICL